MASRIELQLDGESGQFNLQPGEAGETLVRISNVGDVVDAVALSVVGLDPSWYTLTASEVRMFPGQSSAVTLRLHPPAGLQGLAGTYPFQLMATSRDNPASSVSEAMAITLAAVGVLTLDLEPRRVAGRKGLYTVALVNPGNSPRTVVLGATDAEEGLHYRFGSPDAQARRVDHDLQSLQPVTPGVAPVFGDTTAEGAGTVEQELQIPAGGSLLVPLLVAPRKQSWFGRERTLGFEVTTHPPGVEWQLADTQRVNGELVYSPRLAIWAGMPLALRRVLAIGIPLALLALILFLLLRPKDPAETLTTAQATATAIAQATIAAADPNAAGGAGAGTGAGTGAGGSGTGSGAGSGTVPGGSTGAGGTGGAGSGSGAGGTGGTGGSGAAGSAGDGDAVINRFWLNLPALAAVSGPGTGGMGGTGATGAAYRVQITDRNAASPFLYNFIVAAQAEATVAPGSGGCDDQYERPTRNDTRQTAKPMEINAEQVHTFCPQGDQDWMVFTATGGKAYTISTEGVAGPVDSVLTLYDSDGVVIVENDDYQPGANGASRIDYTFPRTGTYLLRVRDKSDSGAAGERQQEPYVQWDVSSAEDVKIEQSSRPVPMPGMSRATLLEYQITVTGTNRVATSTLEVLLVRPAGIESFTGTPITITAGQSTTLQWDVRGGQSATIDGAPIELGPEGSGQIEVTPPFTHNYILCVINSAGETCRSTKIYVIPGEGGEPPLPTLTRAPTIRPNAPAPTATRTRTRTATATNTPFGAPTGTPTRTSLPTRTPTRTNTPTRTGTPTITPTGTLPTATPTGTSTATYTPTATGTPLPTSTSTSTDTVTPTSEPPDRNVPVPVPTRTNTPVPPPLPTNTPTRTRTNTPQPTVTSTRTNTPTFTSTNTPTATSTSTPTFTSTNTPTATSTNTATSTSTNTATSTNTNTATNTATSTNTSTVTPTATCVPVPNYIVTQSTGTIVRGSPETIVTSGVITLPFAFKLYDQTFTQAIVGDNGTLGFIANSNPVTNTALPNAAFNFAILPYWDDLQYQTCDGPCRIGIYTSVTGTAPNREFHIEWSLVKPIFSGRVSTPVNFELRLYENSPVQQFDIIYGTVYNNGNEATVGVQRDTGSRFTQYSFNQPRLFNGQRLIFTLPCSSTGIVTPTVQPPPLTCETFNSPDVPKQFPSEQPQNVFVTSVLTITTPGFIQDLNLVNLNMTRAWREAITVTLISPLGTEVALFNWNPDQCTSSGTLTNITLDDEAPTAMNPVPCTGRSGFLSPYRPAGSLSVYDGTQMAGRWTLRMEIATDPGTGGQLNSWGLNICNVPGGVSPIPTATMTSTPTITPTATRTFTPTPTRTPGFIPPRAAEPTIEPNQMPVEPPAPPTPGSAQCETASGAGAPVPGQGELRAVGEINLTQVGTVKSVTVKDLDLSGYVGRAVQGVLVSPGGEEVRLFKWPACRSGSPNQIKVSFEDGAQKGLPACGKQTLGTFKPEVPLASLAGEQAAGTWMLRISAEASEDGSDVQLNGWSLEVCTDPAVLVKGKVAGAWSSASWEVVVAAGMLMLMLLTLGVSRAGARLMKMKK